jgi:hypothetical protein
MGLHKGICRWRKWRRDGARYDCHQSAIARRREIEKSSTRHLLYEELENNEVVADISAIFVIRNTLKKDSGSSKDVETLCMLVDFCDGFYGVGRPEEEFPVGTPQRLYIQAGPPLNWRRGD